MTAASTLRFLAASAAPAAASDLAAAQSLAASPTPQGFATAAGPADRAPSDRAAASLGHSDTSAGSAVASDLAASAAPATAARPQPHAAANSGAIRPLDPTAAPPQETSDLPWVHAADSALQALPVEPRAAAHTVFGTASTLAPAPPAPAPQPSPSGLETALFQGGVLLLAACYAISFYRAPGHIRALFERVFRKTSSPQNLLEDPGSNGFVHFLGRTSLLGMFLLAVLVLKFSQALLPPHLAAPIPYASIPLLGLAALLLWRTLTLCQTSLLRLVGALTVNRPLVAHLVLLRRTYFALATLLAAPAVLLVAFCPPQAEPLWLVLAAGGSITAAVLYVRETLRLFLSLKISILHWFLYLCGVEMFPVSLLWLLATR